MKTTGVRGIPKFGLLDFLGHPNQQPRVGVNDCFQVHDFATHEKEIDDIDFSPDSARLLSVSKDKVRYYLWSKIPSITFPEGHSLGCEEGEEAR